MRWLRDVRSGGRSLRRNRASGRDGAKVRSLGANIRQTIHEGHRDVTVGLRSRAPVGRGEADTGDARPARGGGSTGGRIPGQRLLRTDVSAARRDDARPVSTEVWELAGFAERIGSSRRAASRTTSAFSAERTHHGWAIDVSPGCPCPYPSSRMNLLSIVPGGLRPCLRAAPRSKANHPDRASHCPV
jgi:hypothetical protein